MEKTYTLMLMSSQVDQIGAALADRPFKEVAGLLNDLTRQIQQQQAADAATVAPPAPPAE